MLVWRASEAEESVKEFTFPFREASQGVASIVGQKY